MEPHRPSRFVCPDAGSGATLTYRKYVLLPVMEAKLLGAILLEPVEVPKVVLPRKRVKAVKGRV